MIYSVILILILMLIIDLLIALVDPRIRDEVIRS
jgi:ABC-type dipeptide/oligopeptide/nickel transport system permease component